MHRNGKRSGRERPIDPWSELGLSPGAGRAEISGARKRLARAAHPDVGGSVEAMQRVNRAAELALADSVAERTAALRTREPSSGPMRRDHPSFTIEALPAEAFEGLLIAANWGGEVIDDDPPYRLEVLLGEPAPAWCRLELVPDAGATTVSLTVARSGGHPDPDVLRVRDRWIEALNQLDWSRLDPERPPPS